MSFDFHVLIKIRFILIGSRSHNGQINVFTIVPNFCKDTINLFNMCFIVKQEVISIACFTDITANLRWQKGLVCYSWPRFFALTINLVLLFHRHHHQQQEQLLKLHHQHSTISIIYINTITFITYLQLNVSISYLLLLHG